MEFTPELRIAGHLAVAALAGLAVGIERQWSGHATGPEARFAGMRTFLLLGAIGGIAGWLSLDGATPLAIAIASGTMLLVVVAYYRASQRGSDAVEGTTEAAALAVVAIGIVAGRGHLAIAGGAAAILVTALWEKHRLHDLVRHLGESELRATFIFSVLALVVLPILPAGPFPPFDSVRPRLIWTVVLLISGVNFAGYVARRMVGSDRGYVIAGLLGGLVSSTAVALNFAKQSRESGSEQTALGLGIVAASTVLIPRTVVLAAVLNGVLGMALVLPLLPVFAVGLSYTLWGVFRGDGQVSDPPGVQQRSPLRLRSAMQMALLFQLILVLVAVARQLWGEQGVLASAAIVGLTDADGLTLSMSQLASDPTLVSLGARAIVVGMLANTVLKAAFALALGEGAARRVAASGFALLFAALLAGLWIAGTV